MTEFRLYRENGKERLQMRTATPISMYELSHKGSAGLIQIGNQPHKWSDWTDVPVVEAPKVPKTFSFSCRLEHVPDNDRKNDVVFAAKNMIGDFPLDQFLEGKRWRVVCTEIL